MPKKLPAAAMREARKRGKRMPKKRGKGPRPLRMDPTRTASLRRAFIAEIKRDFASLKRDVLRLIVEEDALGLDPSKPQLQVVGNPSSCFVVNGTCVNCGGPGSGVPGPCPSKIGTGDSMASQALKDKWVQKTGITVGNPTLLQDPSKLSDEEYAKLPVIYHGGPATSDHIYVTNDPNLAAQHGDVKKFRLAPGTKVYADPETHEEMLDAGHRGAAINGHTALFGLRSGSAIIARERAWPFDKPISFNLEGSLLLDQIENFLANCGGVGGVPGPCPAGISARVIVAVKAKIQARFDKLSLTYGRRGAQAIVVTTLVMLPIPIPGSSLLPIGVAKGSMLVKRLLSRRTANAKPTRDDLAREAERLLAELCGMLGVEVPPSSQEKIRETVDAFLDAPTVNAGRWQFQTDAAKRDSFKRWLQRELMERSRKGEKLWERYVEEGFRKGAGRSFEDVRGMGGLKSGDGVPLTSKLDFYRGTKEEFLRSAFAQPVAVEKVKILASRSFDDLEDITSTMSNRIVRKLTDGLVEGKGPREIGRDLSREVDIGLGRATMIARTEIVRAHAEGQLMALEQLGVEDVGVMVEWSTTGDDLVCFPAWTMVATEVGERPIQEVEVGDMVWTRKGLRRVLECSKRDYGGPMTTIVTDFSWVTSTAGHLFWANGIGWSKASSLRPGDNLQLLSKKVAEVTAAVNFSLGDAEYSPTMLDQERVLPGILDGVLMPIGSVAFNRYPNRRNEEVYGVPADGTLLHELNPDIGQGLSDGLLDGRFSGVPSVAGELAESPVGIPRTSPELCSAGSTDLKGDGASAFFGAVTPLQSSLLVGAAVKERLAAGRARSVLAAVELDPALAGAVSHPRSDAALDLEFGSATGADLGHGVGPGDFVAVTGAVPSVARTTPVGLLATHRAGNGLAGSVEVDEARVRAEPLGSAGAGMPGEHLLALRAFEREWHDEPLGSESKEIGNRLPSIIPVYCLKVEGEPEFFANGILVHNCEMCVPLEGTVLKIDEAQGMLPRHPNCRCAWIPANVGEDEEDQKRGQKEVKAALSDSEEEGGNDSWGPNTPISSFRPPSVLDQLENMLASNED